MSNGPTTVYYETRFAVVLYGGISLAIYINGVAQELNRMVRATARRGDGSYVLQGELSQLEKVYRDLGEKLGTRFVIDILSGTSAGGLNAIYLAKALANNQEFDGFAEVWKKTADVATLIYDRQSVEGLPIRLKVPENPAYLMNSQRMGFLLYEEFRKMDRQAAEDGIDVSQSSFNRELDLFVTATDLYGRQLNLQTSDPDFAQKEKKFRHVFHLRYREPRSGEAAVNDFVEANNPFLAFICRCTSAIPPAFEPMLLEDMSAFPRIQIQPGWKKFFSEPAGKAYQTRPFADGGYLDNKPFSYAAEAMRGRRANRPVDRILFYVEPSPEHLDPAADHGPRPNLVDNLSRLGGMRAAESIREDLERIRERNRLITKNARTLQKIESALLDPDREIRTISKRQFVTSDLKASINAMGPAYGAYLTQRVDAWREGMARWITEEKQVAPYTREQRLIARAVDAWFNARYTDERDEMAGPDGDSKELWNHFLFQADIDWQLRRLHFLDRKINTLLLFWRIIKTAPDPDYYRDFIKDLDEARMSEESGEEEVGTIPNLVIDVRQATQDYWQARAGTAAAEEWDDQGEDIDTFLDERVEGEYFRIIRRHLGLDAEDFEAQAQGAGDTPSLREFCEGRLRDEVESSLNRRKADLAAEAAWRVAESKKKGVGKSKQSHHLKISKFMARLEDWLAENRSLLADPVESQLWDDFFRALSSIKQDLNAIRDRYYRGIAQARKDENLKAIVVPAPGGSPDDMNHQVGTFLDAYVASIDDTFKELASAIRDALGNSAYRPATFDDRENGGRLACLYLQTFYENYEYFDKLTYSLVTAAELGEMDEIDVWRISPEDTTLLPDAQKRRQKLGGQTLGHFGAFFREDWRTNDILWGRLDGAERVIKALLPGKKEQEPVILRARAAILRDEVGRRNDRLVEILQKENIPIKSYAVDPSVSDMDLLSAFRRGFEIDLTLEPQSTLKLLGRGTRVAGKMVQGLEKEYQVDDKGFAARLAQFGQLFIWIVEAATAGSWLHAIAGNVFALLYFLGTLLVAIGALAGLESSKFDNWGWAVILATVLVQYLRFAVRVIFQHREVFDLRKKE